MLEKDLCQLNAHAPTAGELTSRPVEVTALEAQTRQGTLHLSLVILSSHHHIALMGLGELVNQGHVVFTLIVGALGHLLLHLGELLLDMDMSGESLACFLAHSCVILKFHHLWQIAHGRAVGHRHCTGSRLLQATEYFQHGGLSGTVLTHKSHTVAVVDDKADIVEQRPGTKLHLEILY